MAIERYGEAGDEALVRPVVRREPTLLPLARADELHVVPALAQRVDHEAHGPRHPVDLRG